MERKFLEELGLEKENIDKVLDVNSADIGRQKKQLEELEAKAKSLESQLSDANKAIDGMKEMDVDSIKQAAADWEKKYKEDSETWKAELAKANYAHAVETQALKEQFSSESARKAFISELTAKNLPCEDGKITGYDDFKKQYVESDPKAFVSEDDTTTMKASSGGKHTEAGSVESDAFTAAAMKGAGLEGEK